MSDTAGNTSMIQLWNVITWKLTHTDTQTHRHTHTHTHPFLQSVWINTFATQKQEFYTTRKDTECEIDVSASFWVVLLCVCVCVVTEGLGLFIAAGCQPTAACLCLCSRSLCSVRVVTEGQMDATSNPANCFRSPSCSSDLKHFLSSSCKLLTLAFVFTCGSLAPSAGNNPVN